ncbi:hypothetical protein BAV3277 [Bordetella avium 197N]|uniref:Uncharacterized protein n=1 Tax=Bordetella avium (strain 197N) TaxID=360910 RepID=Q2KTX3_BORA1|nr:hypothetical protein BAV3277 [Bordetella avium 197N]
MVAIGFVFWQGSVVGRNIGPNAYSDTQPGGFRAHLAVLEIA